MTKPPADSKEFLLQTDLTTEILPQLATSPWLTVYLDIATPADNFGISCALLEARAVPVAMETDTWDLGLGCGRPGMIYYGRSENFTYHRFGGDDGVRPFVLRRSFHGAFPEYNEIDEEFRLYHDLAFDQERGVLLSFDASGRESVVARISKDKIDVRLKYVRSFLAATQLTLAIYFDSVRRSSIPLDSLGEHAAAREDVTAALRWGFATGEPLLDDKFASFSRVLGKAIVAPPPFKQAGLLIQDGQRDEREVKFIIGYDENGEEVEYTSSHKKLSNFFGANPGAPNYLTPVFFRREVLNKYYGEPERYGVRDGYLSCIGLWGCQIDNDIDGHVAVFLGDLGRDLPYEERLYWRTFNVAPDGRLSKTNVERSFMAKAAEPTLPDLVFRYEYPRLSRLWEERYGWTLWLPMMEGDSHLIGCVRLPGTNSQIELDQQIGFLTKLLVDSLNESEIGKTLAEEKKALRGIAKFDAFLELQGVPDRALVITFLKDLQGLRSSGSAHRKGTSYDQTLRRLGFTSLRKSEIGRNLLSRAVDAIRHLGTHLASGTSKEAPPT